MKRRVLTIALIAATAACSSATQTRLVSVRPVDSQPVGLTGRDALDRGDLLFSRGDYALALDAYRKAVRSDASDAHALNGVAISYAAMGRHDLAREYFELALARAPQDLRIYRNFARSLEAQGLRTEAQILMAQAGSGSPVLSRAVRPTLAQLAADGSRGNRTGTEGVPALELERLSLGEVRLRTLPSPTQNMVASERMASQLSTRIVTLADGMTRELTAPIVTVGPALVAQSKQTTVSANGADHVLREAPPVQAVEKRPVAFAKAPSAYLDTLSGCGKARQASKQQFRLPATGYSIDLTMSGKGADTISQCASWAGKDARDGLFERLWKGWLSGSSRKDVAG